MVNSKIILIAAIFGFGLVFLGNFISSLGVPEPWESYLMVGAALIFVFTVLYVAEKNGIKFR